MMQISALENIRLQFFQCKITSAVCWLNVIQNYQVYGLFVYIRFDVD